MSTTERRTRATDRCPAVFLSRSLSCKLRRGPDAIRSTASHLCGGPIPSEPAHRLQRNPCAKHLCARASSPHGVLNSGPSRPRRGICSTHAAPLLATAALFPAAIGSVVGSGSLAMHPRPPRPCNTPRPRPAFWGEVGDRAVATQVRSHSSLLSALAARSARRPWGRSAVLSAGQMLQDRSFCFGCVGAKML